MKVALVGGTGLLGRSIADIYDREGGDYVVAGRSARGDRGVVADLASGSGIAEAIDGANTVILLASNPSKPKTVDVAGTRRLLPLLDDRHLIYVSIVGVDSHPFPYYRAKFQVEQLIRESSVSYSIVRATQFHDFVGFLIDKMTKGPLAFVPRGFVFQPIATSEVAEHLVDVAKSRSIGDLPDLAGPEIHGIEHLARTYMEAVGKERPILKVPLPSRSAAAFRNGVHTNADRAVGRQTWEQYLDGLR